ncbi:hypothetical protein CK203_109079 [Vitis vinifera]|uniref:Uncharacterized protein n=1 Tax=Vitis vinifera TaxID=29760 RepID=A0A438CYX1_VITVI|nr:hypothetical protein CK203_109079 [Vitis vinifera]
MEASRTPKAGSLERVVHGLELEPYDYSNGTGSAGSDPMNALQILRETVWILRYNSSGFMLIAALLICPSSGLPLRPFIKQSCQKFSEMAISAATCFPLYFTISLLSKAAVVYSVDCSYSRKKFDSSKFYVIVVKIWRRLVSTYLWVCMLIVSCLTVFLVTLIAVCNVFLIIGFPGDLIVYAAIMVGLIFSVVFAKAIIICNIAIVICVLEEVSGPQALLRSGVLIKAQGEDIELWRWVFQGMGRALLVVMYSFVVLIDSMMSAVFYFSCRSSSREALDGEIHPILETPASMDIQ